MGTRHRLLPHRVQSRPHARQCFGRIPARCRKRGFARHPCANAQRAPHRHHRRQSHRSVNRQAAQQNQAAQNRRNHRLPLRRATTATYPPALHLPRLSVKPCQKSRSLSPIFPSSGIGVNIWAVSQKVCCLFFRQK